MPSIEDLRQQFQQELLAIRRTQIREAGGEADSGDAGYLAEFERLGIDIKASPSNPTLAAELALGVPGFWAARGQAPAPTFSAPTHYQGEALTAPATAVQTAAGLFYQPPAAAPLGELTASPMPARALAPEFSVFGGGDVPGFSSGNGAGAIPPAIASGSYFGGLSTTTVIMLAAAAAIVLYLMTQKGGRR